MLNDLYRTLTQLEPKLIGMISQIDDDSVMAMCLIVNDDLHKTFERYCAVKEGRVPEAFVPGESLTQTLLTPNHIYTKLTDNLGKAEARSAAPSQQPAADVDLFDLMSSGQRAPQ